MARYDDGGTTSVEPLMGGTSPAKKCGKKCKKYLKKAVKSHDKFSACGKLKISALPDSYTEQVVAGIKYEFKNFEITSAKCGKFKCKHFEAVHQEWMKNQWSDSFDECEKVQKRQARIFFNLEA